MSCNLLNHEDIKKFEFDVHDREPLFFDIETGPCEVAEMQGLMPEFHAPSNWKDPAKIEANIAEQENKWLENAALNPLVGEIVAFGFRYKETNYAIDWGEPTPEQVLLHGIELLAAKAGPRTWVGHNIKDFDLPFILRRFMKYQIPQPSGWFKDRYWSTWFVDTSDLWALGKFKDYIGLDPLAKFLGHKDGKFGKSGKYFADTLKVDPDVAYEYLANDLELTEYVYRRLTYAG